MRATGFEFRYRFWILALVFGLGFWAYALDPRNAGQALAGNGRLAAHGIFGFAAFLVGLAALLRTWGSAYLDSERVHDTALRTDGVVADGPYRHVRNPLYLGTLLLAVGMGLLASRLGFAVLVLGVLIVTLQLIGREEAELLATQGESYRSYLAAVPRLLPSLRSRVPAGGLRPRWGQALAGEIFSWLFFAGTAYFAATLNARSIPVISAVAVGVYAIMLIVLKRWRTSRGGAGGPG
jgi:protein-S-isoprenylcysteine O-methyltransferase Ste14